ncbi:hypothetical protein ATI61_101454 [Archangium gephyra]|uniref:Uncharacterized protein n=1 Tax=Archangium gephyra TaxID=48 RepID=A0AAC8QBA5_9BACT|nr:hypothetical protein [Archangium gephyra]AKJ04458.1 Hypothetical protein AA314_06084 [Archangium gephyra]REG37470.1 hypothetical protein ATI61_101454 [Archangium gephyra]
MPVLFALFALAVPRLVVLVLWFFTGWFRGMFDTVLWPILGFIFLPTTLLWYSAVQHWFDGQWTLWPIVGLVLSLMLDVWSKHGRGQQPEPRPPRHVKTPRRPVPA